MASTEGYLIISDITGYTSFLNHSELDHAEEILRALLDSLIEHTRVPLVISRLEGDAVISYSPAGSVLQGQTLVEIMETTYVSFRRALELMILNTSCTCNACRNIPQLDLKFFVHYGAFALQSLPAYTELIGNDVNLLHRLTKNHVVEKTGLKAYVLYTHAAMQAMELDELAESLPSHVETYEHIGDVQVYVQDMQAVWAESRARSRVAVMPEEALLTVEHVFPVDQVLAWEVATKPEYRAILSGSESARVTGRSGGRLGPGVTYQCVHGKNLSPQTIVDWQPFDQYSYETPIVGSCRVIATVTFSPVEQGTRVTVSWGKSLGGSAFMRWLVNVSMPFLATKEIRAGMDRVAAKIQQDLQAGLIFAPEAASIPNAAKGQAVQASLAEVIA